VGARCDGPRRVRSTRRGLLFRGYAGGPALSDPTADTQPFRRLRSYGR